MIKILHCADLHLDSPFRALPPEQAALRRQEQRAVLDTLTDLSEQCDLVLIAGDLLDGTRVYQDTLEALTRSFSRFHCPVLIAPGNHDFYVPGGLYDRTPWPETVHIFRSSAITELTFPELGCRVYGAAFRGSESGPLLSGFRAKPDGLINLMVLHGEVGTAGSPYNPITREEIAASGLDYLALGHIHQSSGLLQAGRTRYGWPGCTVGRGFDETGFKGVSLITLDGEACHAETIPLQKKRYEVFTVEAGSDPVAAARLALPADSQQVCCRIIFTGPSAPLDLTALHRQLAPHVFSLDLKDHTVPLRDPWEGRGENNLKGLLLQTLWEAAQDNPDAAAAARLAAEFSVCLLEGREVPSL